MNMSIYRHIRQGITILVLIAGINRSFKRKSMRVLRKPFLHSKIKMIVNIKLYISLIM